MSRKKKHASHEAENGEAWLLPYSDLMTLLLAVFIVLFAVSKVDAGKAAQISQEFRESMMTKSAAAQMSQQQQTKQSSSGKDAATQSGISEIDLEKYMGEYELDKLKELKAEIDAKIVKEGMDTSVTTSIDMRGLVVSLNNAVFFESGSADIKKENEQTLVEVATMINTLNNYIRIEGHTDNVPMHSEIYPSNWELSSARAASVVQLFINNSVPPEKLVSVGYGEYRPVADNSTAEGRAKNRRIDIIVLSEKYNNLEKQLTE
ncbi:OmpA/MotB family protein [Aminipila luticellarii]|uniref:Chemotaxis protein MotB n=1 Tax=Aminipila luticellarii TaxID=2507160 RepID=A0A410PTK7_9FIRM|nr:flagellar motor protein MotB [Aminipila luticellarii]QAT42230.1 chemotaxis protein MotB [Aminipila luticellarii]